MADHLSDEEQLQLLKNWWNENGRFLVLAVITALAVYFGWQWWNQHQKTYAEGAAAVYTELSETVAAGGDNLSEEQAKTAQFLIEQLQNDYGKTLYAANASLLAGKLAVEKDDLATAESELNKALSSKDEDIQAIAALRLARVYLAQAKYDEALEQAAYDKDDAFSSAYAALRGDIFAAKGDSEQARAAYQQALDSSTASGGIQRQMLEIKLSNLAKAGDQS